MSETTDPTSDETHHGLETGWRVVAEKPSLVSMIDALLSVRGGREFNKSELADFAGVSRHSVHAHVDTLRRLGVLETVPDSSPQRFRFVADSPVSRALVELDAAVCNTDSR